MPPRRVRLAELREEPHEEVLSSRLEFYVQREPKDFTAAAAIDLGRANNVDDEIVARGLCQLFPALHAALCQLTLRSSGSALAWMV